MSVLFLTVTASPWAIDIDAIAADLVVLADDIEGLGEFGGRGDASGRGGHMRGRGVRIGVCGRGGVGRGRRGGGNGGGIGAGGHACAENDCAGNDGARSGGRQKGERDGGRSHVSTRCCISRTG